MDRKKSKLNNIVVQFDAIINETIVLKENIEHVVNQVYSCVEFFKQSPESLKQKSTEILKYELEVLTNLVDINSMLENLSDSNCFSKLNAPLKKYDSGNNSEYEVGSNTRNVDLQPINVNIIQNDCQGGSVSDTQPDLIIRISESYTPDVSRTDSVTSAGELIHSSHSRNQDMSHYISPYETHSVTLVEEDGSNSQIPQNHSSINEGHCLGEESVVQIFRQNMKILNEKLAINSTASLELEYQYENSNPVPAENETNTCDPHPTLDTPQIPGKDTTEMSGFWKIDEKCASNKSNIENSYSSYSTHVNKDSSNTNYEIESQLSDSGTVYLESDQCVKIKEDSCSNVIEQINVSSNSTSLGSSLDHHSTNIKTPSALRKLNQYEGKTITTIIDEPLQIPDISLKPTVLENIPSYMADSIELKSSKNGVKNKSEFPTDTIKYYLKPKEIPKVRDVCVFSHIESPAEFYLHIADEETGIIDNMNEHIDAQFKDTISKYRKKEDAFYDIDKYCCAFIGDYNNWFRVSIKDWIPDDLDTILVQLVDFGNMKITSFKNLRKLTKELSEIPMLAVRCHLPIMYPPDSTKLNRLSEWPISSIEEMCNLAGIQRGSQSDEFEFVYVEKGSNSIAVDLLSISKKTGEDTVGQILLNLGCAIQIIDNYEDGSEEEEFLEYTNDMENADNINEAVMGYDPKDEARICRFSNSDGTCFKGKHCKLQHVSLPEDGFTTDTEIVFRESFNQLHLPKPKEIVTILITQYIDSCRFFAHIVRNPQRESNYFIERDIVHLQEVMNNKKMIRTYEPFKISPALGEMVLVKDVSETFKRAVVREVKCSNNGCPMAVHVFTLDFGETFTADINHVRKIKAQFLHLPFQTIECFISGYRANMECNQSEARIFFDNNLYLHNFSAHVMSSFVPLKIKMTSLDGEDVGQVMEKYNFAEKYNCDNNPFEDCALNLDG